MLRIKKTYCVVILCAFFIFFAAMGHSLAQTSGSETATSAARQPTTGGNTTSTSCAITKVGDPKTDPPALPAECTQSSNGSVGGSGGTCQATTTIPSDPAQAIETEFGVTFLPGFPKQQLQWVYEEFTAVKQTGFLPLVKGAILTATDRADWVSWQEDCPVEYGGGEGPDVHFNTNLDEVATKTLIIHELTHVIQICVPNGKTNRSEMPGIREAEGGLTHYSQSGCGFDIDLDNEDHAETIAFHLNPFSPEQTCAAGGNPYEGGAHPLHKALAIKLVGNYACSQ